MICPACKSQNIEGADVCANCGNALYGLDLPDAGLKSPSPAFIHESLDKLPQRPVVTVEASDPAGLVVRRMQAGDTGAVLVLDGGAVVGIITATDILHKVAGRTDDLNAVSCSQIMTPNPVVFEPDESIAVAINKMSVGDYRHLPIVQDGKPVSVIDVTDLFRYISPKLV